MAANRLKTDKVMHGCFAFIYSRGKLNHRPVRDNLLKKKTFGKCLVGGRLGVSASCFERPASCPGQAAHGFTK
jgi:hypothetical protein